MSKFWENGGFFVDASALDNHLSGDSTVRDYAMGREVYAGAIPSGTRVSFSGTLSSLLAYPSPPERGETGTVVMVRTAMGDCTGQDGTVFVKMDGGRLMALHRAHLRSVPATTRTATAYRLTVSSMGDLTDFMKSSGDDLVHKSSKDLWKLSRQGEDYVIERLFDDTGKPLKV